MFLESQINHPMQKGSIEVICGSMFSGKTEELLRRLKRAEFAKLKIAVFKPQVDVRYDEGKVVSHDSNTITSNPIQNPIDILMQGDVKKGLDFGRVETFLGPFRRLFGILL